MMSLTCLQGNNCLKKTVKLDNIWAILTRPKWCTIYYILLYYTYIYFINRHRGCNECKCYNMSWFRCTLISLKPLKNNNPLFFSKESFAAKKQKQKKSLLLTRLLTRPLTSDQAQNRIKLNIMFALNFCVFFLQICI